MTDHKKYIHQLKKLMIKKGISQKEVSLRTGLAANSISRIFKFENSPSLKNLVLIADAIGAELPDFQVKN